MTHFIVGYRLPQNFIESHILKWLNELVNYNESLWNYWNNELKTRSNWTEHTMNEIYKDLQNCINLKSYK